jgi:pantoate--beta-alanine ligase
MIVARTVRDVRAALAVAGAARGIGSAPTMGALHAGHAALFRAARAECGRVVASLFVNPRQFNDRADLEAYPRQEARDAEAAAAAGVDVLFVPDAAEIYPQGFDTTVTVGGPASGFEGARRPGHFDGVATICLKLINIVRPTLVYLGQKDAQQVAVLTQMVRDLDLEIGIRVVPTVREPDGVALSSRNARLSPADRARAGAIPRALRAALAAQRQGDDPASAARYALGGLDVDYAEVVDLAGTPTLVVAVTIGGNRLIDNVPLRHPELAGL